MKMYILVTFLILAGLVIACGGSGGGSGDAVASVSPSAHAEAAEIYTSRCVTCHGPQGKGDGPGSAGLVPPPQDLTKKQWQKSVTDEHIERIIQYGGAGVQMSPQMPPNPDLASKPEVITALRIKVRELGVN